MNALDELTDQIAEPKSDETLRWVVRPTTCTRQRLEADAKGKRVPLVIGYETLRGRTVIDFMPVRDLDPSNDDDYRIIKRFGM